MVKTGLSQVDPKAEAGDRRIFEGKTCILILEDNPSDAELIEYELKKNGIGFVSRRVETEQSYRQALLDHCPDLILSDYDLPQFNGSMALKIAAEICPGVPFILVTGAISEDRAIDIMSGGATDYVLKSRLSKLPPVARRAISEAAEHERLSDVERDRDNILLDMETRFRERTTALEQVIMEREQAEERLRLALLCAQEGAWDWNLRTNSLIWDQRCREIFGLSPEIEVSFESFLKLVHPDDQKRVRARAVAALKNREEFDQEFRIPKPDGTSGWVISRGRGYYSESGEAERMLGTFVEITGSRQAEQELRIALQQLTAHMANSPLAVLEVDRQFRIVRWSGAAESLFGWSASEAIGKTFAELSLIHEEDAGKVNLLFQKMVDGHQPRNFNANRNYRKDRSVLYCEWYNSAVYSESGSLISILSLGLDMTEHKRTEDNLKDSQRRLLFALESAGLGSWDLDLSDPGKSHHSLLHDRIFGYENGAPEWNERIFFQHILPEDRESVWTHIKSAISTGQPWEFECRIIRRDGELRWVWARGETIEADHTGRPRSVRGVIQDITDRKHAEEAVKERGRQLEEANRELESFNYMVSHDLRAPLRGIMGFTRMLREDGGAGLSRDPVKRVAAIWQNALKMDRMIDSLLVFSRYGRKSLHKSAIDMEALLQEVLNDFSSEIERRKINIVRDKTLPRAMGDRDLIRQVWTNLLSNAIKFTSRREGAVIEIIGLEETPENRFCVKDNGVGFDMQYRDRLFSVFQRLHLAGEYEGTGVGLAIVHRIINRHGGRVWADAAVGRGATFCFTLPNH